MITLFLQKCEVTNPEVWLDATGQTVAVGDEEWRLLDHPEDPSWSADFLTKEDALSWAAENEYHVVRMLR